MKISSAKGKIGVRVGTKSQQRHLTGQGFGAARRSCQLVVLRRLDTTIVYFRGSMQSLDHIYSRLADLRRIRPEDEIACRMKSQPEFALLSEFIEKIEKRMANSANSISRRDCSWAWTSCMSFRSMWLLA
jgi:hypothetical protein